MTIVIIGFNVLLLVVACHVVWTHHKRNTVLKELIDSAVDCSWMKPSEWDIEKLVMDSFSNTATARLDKLVDQKKRELIDKKTTERIETVVDEWCANYTSEHYEALLRVRLKLDVKDRLAQKAAESMGDEY